MSEVDRLAKWILDNCPEEIGRDKSESAVDVAIRLMRECLAWRVDATAQKPKEEE